MECTNLQKQVPKSKPLRGGKRMQEVGDFVHCFSTQDRPMVTVDRLNCDVLLAHLKANTYYTTEFGYLHEIQLISKQCVI